jgi:hypothetical protein
MPAMETIATIIVKPKTPQGWVMVTPRLHSEIYFHGRQRALQFARAYAKLHRPVRICVLNETGDVEVEETLAGTLCDSGHATQRVGIATLVCPSS